MALVAMMCPACNAKLEIEEGRDVFFCSYCGAQVEREIQRVEMSGNVELASQTIDAQLKRAETFIELGDWNKANKIYDEITDLYPQDYRGWWGEIVCATKNFSAYVPVKQHSVWYGYIEKTINDSCGFAEMERTYEAYAKKCRKYEQDNQKIERLHNHVKHIKETITEAEKKAREKRDTSSPGVFVFIGTVLLLIGIAMGVAGSYIAWSIFLIVSGLALIIIGISKLSSRRKALDAIKREVYKLQQEEWMVDQRIEELEKTKVVW